MKTTSEKTIRRIIGVLMLVIGIAGIILSIGGIAIGGRVVDQVAVGVEELLSLTSKSLDTLETDLLQAQTVLQDVGKGLDTAGTASADISEFLKTTEPILDTVTGTVGTDIPEGIDSVQQVLSNVAQAAKGIDDTVKAVRDIAGILSIDLDITTSLEEPVGEIGTALSDLSSEIRDLGDNLAKTSQDVATLSQDAHAVANDLAVISDGLAEFSSTLDEDIAVVKEIHDTVRQAQAGVDRQAKMAKLLITILMVWLALAQITPLYLGWELVASRRNTASMETPSQ